jgi:hypothetical protein
MLKMVVLWNVSPFGLGDIDRRFRGACYLHQQGDMMMEAAGTSNTSVNFCQTAGRKVSEDSHPPVSFVST